MITSRITSLVLALVVIGGSIAYIQYGKVSPSKNTVVVDVPLPTTEYSDNQNGPTIEDFVDTEDVMVSGEKKENISDRLDRKSKLYQRAKEITTPDGFINSNGEPVSIGQYVGKKVVLLDIWTYSCINCQRTTPYLNSWYEKYESNGFVIIGLHTPEFEFEKNYDNVRAAVEKFGIKFPVVLDNDYSTWNAYGNLYWPRKYLIDIDGFITYDHIGEGGYEETEKKIQEALKERAKILGENAHIDAPLTKEISTQNLGIISPETYFGSLRNEYFANGTPGQSITDTFILPDVLQRSRFYLEGVWNITKEYAESDDSNTVIVYPYTAKEVYLVASALPAVTVEVYRGGKALGHLAGEDVIEKEGGLNMKISDSRLYKIVKEESISAHTLELVVKGKGLKAFAFTFGN